MRSFGKDSFWEVQRMGMFVQKEYGEALFKV